MSEKKGLNVGVAGITGRFAGLILDHLSQYGGVTIRGYCRNASKLAPRFAALTQICVIQGNADDAQSLAGFVRGLDVVICAYLGDNDFMVEAQKHLIDACDDAGVPRYIASDYCLDYTKLEMGQMPAKDPMKIIHSYITGKTRVKGVHVLIGAFMETFWSPSLQVYDGETQTLSYYGSGAETWESTTYGDAAQYTAAVALDTNAVGIKKFLGDKKTIDEIAQAFQSTYGFKPRMHRRGTVEDLYAEMHARFRAEPADPSGWLGLFYQYYCTNGQTWIAGDLDDEQYAQVKPKTFESFLRTTSLQELPNTMANLGKQ